MASPQTEDGLTPIANELLDAIIRTHFSPTEHTLILVIIRKTYGWHKKTDRISYTQFEEATGINRRHIAPALQSLMKRRIIIRQGEGYNLEYGIQKDYDLWATGKKFVTDISNEIVTENGNESLPKTVMIEKDIVTENGNESLPKTVMTPKTQSLPVSPKSLPKTVTKSLPNRYTQNKEINITKEINNITIKENIKEKRGIDLPEWLSQEVWDAFVEMRIKIKHPLTEYAQMLAIKKLTRLRNQGEDANEILEKAILNSWRGIYSQKDERDKNGGNGHGVNQGHTQKTATRGVYDDDARTAELKRSWLG